MIMLGLWRILRGGEGVEVIGTPERLEELGIEDCRIIIILIKNSLLDYSLIITWLISKGIL